MTSTSEETELNWSDAGNISPVYAAVPNLDSLTVRSGRMAFGKIDLPNLRELVIITGGLDKPSLKAICTATWPRLERLSIQLGNETEFTLKDLQPIFDGSAFPKVKHLGLGNSKVTDLICTGLAGSRIGNQLESIDLSLGTMGDAGATALAGGKFPKLVSLDVASNYLTTKGIAALKKVATKVDTMGNHWSPAATRVSAKTAASPRIATSPPTSDQRTAAINASHTASTCAAVRSGNIGSEIISVTLRSAIGQLPGPWPRCTYARWRWIGVG